MNPSKQPAWTNFSLRFFLLTFVAISIVFALLHRETIRIGSASIGFLCGVCLASELIKLSATNLAAVVAQSWRQRSGLPFVGRIRWLLVDSIILVLLFALISIANFVLRESTGGAAWLILLGACLIPLGVWFRKSIGRRFSWL